MTSEAEWNLMGTLAASFVQQYYPLLVSNSASLSGWYSNDSFLACGDAPTEEAKPHPLVGGGIRDISAKLAKLSSELAGRKIAIFQANSQPTVGNSVILSLWGAAISESDVRHFHHTVVLCPGDETTFFIRNEMFEFLPKPIITAPVVVDPAPPTPQPQHETPSVAPVQSQAPVAEVTADPVVPEPPVPKPTQEPREKALSKASKKAAKKQPVAPPTMEPTVIEPQPAEVAEPAEPTPSPAAVQPPAAPEPAKTKGAAPRGWSSIVAQSGATGTTKQASIRVVAAPPADGPAVAAPAAAVVAEPPKAEQEQPQVSNKAPRAPRAQAPPRAKPACSLHFVISNELTEEELRAALGDAGKHLLNFRQISKQERVLIFADFDADVHDQLRNERPEVGGRRINVKYAE